MIIKVKTLTGKEIPVEVSGEDKVYHIKELLEEKEGIPASQQRLIFHGKQMYVYLATVKELGSCIFCSVLLTRKNDKYLEPIVC